MPLTTQQKRALLIDHGYNPTKYELDEDGNVFDVVPSIEEQAHQQGVEQGLEAGKGLKGEVRTAANTLKSSAAPGIVGGAVGLGTLGLLGAAPFTGGSSLIPLVGSLVAGGLASYGTEKAQEAIKEKIYTPEEIERAKGYSEGLQSDNKIGATVGNLIPQFATFRPSVNSLKQLGGAAKNTLALNPVTIPQATAVKNALVGGSISAGQNIGEQAFRLGTGEQTDFDPESLVQSTLTGGLMSEPTQFAKTLSGGHLQTTPSPNAFKAKLSKVEGGTLGPNTVRNLDTGTLQNRPAYEAWLNKKNEQDAKDLAMLKQKAVEAVKTGGEGLTPEEQKILAENYMMAANKLTPPLSPLEENSVVSAESSPKVETNEDLQSQLNAELGQTDDNTPFQPQTPNRNIPREGELRKAQEEGAHFGVDVALANRNITTPSGTEVRGRQKDYGEGQRPGADLSPEHWTSDTPYHEVLHKYVSDLLGSSDKTDREMGQKALEVIKSSPQAQEFLKQHLEQNPHHNLNDAAEEYLAQIGGEKFAQIVENEASGKNGGKVVEYFKTLANNWRSRFGTPTPENMAEYLINRGRSGDAYDYNTSLNPKWRTKQGGGDKFQPLPIVGGRPVFTTSTEKELTNQRPFGLTPNKQDAFSTQSLVSKLNSIVPKGEMELLRENGLDEFLSGKVQVGREEFGKWLSENSPSLEVKKMGSGASGGDTASNYAHEFETRFNDKYSIVNEFGSVSDQDGKVIKAEDVPDAAARDLLLRYRKAYAEGRLIPDSKQKSATQRFTMVNPKPLDQMEGATDILVKRPPLSESQLLSKYKKDLVAGDRGQFNQEEIQARLNAKSVKEIEELGSLVDYNDTPKFREGIHFPNDPNVIGFSRGYTETLPSGEKVWHVFEVQSDWAAKMAKTFGGDRAPQSPEAIQDYKERFADPRLDYYQNLLLKANIQHALETGHKYIAISDGPTVALTEHHDQSDILIGPFKTNEEALAKAQQLESKYPGKERDNFGVQAFRDDPDYYVTPTSNNNTPKLDLFKEGFRPSQFSGDVQHYDKNLPGILRKLTESEGERVSFGEHQNSQQRVAGTGIPLEGGEPSRTTSRDDLLLHEPTDKLDSEGKPILKPKTDITARVYPLDKVGNRLNQESFTQFGKFQPLKKDTIPTNIDLTDVPDAPRKPNEIVPVPRTDVGKLYDQHVPWWPARLLSSVADKVGYEGKTPESNNISSYSKQALKSTLRTATRLVGKYLEPVTSAIDEADLSKSQRTDVRKYLYDMSHEGSSDLEDTIMADPNMRYVAQEAVKSYVGFHEEQRKEGLKINGRAAISREGKFPDIESQETARTVTENPLSAEAKQLREDLFDYWMRVTPDDMVPKKTTKEQFVQKQITDYITAIGTRTSGKDASIEFGALRRAEGLGLPYSWVDKDISSTMQRYFNRASKDLAYWKHIQNDPYMRTILNIPDTENKFDSNLPILPDGTEIQPNNPITGNTRTELLGSLAKNLSDSDAAILSGNRLVASGILGPLSGLKDFVSSSFGDFQYMRPQDVHNWLTSLKDFKEAWDKSFEYGVNRTKINRIQYAADSIGKITDGANYVADLLTKLQGRNLLEKITRAKEFAMGMNLAETFLQAPPTDKTAARFLRLFGEGVEGGAEQWRGNKNIPREVIHEMAAAFVERGQGTYDSRGLPSWAQRGAAAPFFSLNRWSIEKFNNSYKDVYLPLRLEGDVSPLLKATLSGVLGGLAIKKLSEIMSGRLQQQPTISEAEASKEWDQKAYAVASTLNAGDYFGFAGGMVNSIWDSAEGHTKTSNIMFPALDFASNTLGPMLGNWTRAIRQGADVTDATLKFAQDLAANSIQSWRLIANHVGDEQKEAVETANQKRDLKVYKRLEGFPVDVSSQDAGNPYLLPAGRRLKRDTNEEDISKDAIKAVEQAIATSNGKTDIAVRNLQNLLNQRGENVLPNPTSLEKTRLLYGFKDFLIRTKGQAYWNEFAQKYRVDQVLEAWKKHAVGRALGEKGPELQKAFSSLQAEDQ